MARITIVLNEKLFKLCKNIQADKIKNSPKAVSFSSIINEELAKHFKVNLDDK